MVAKPKTASNHHISHQSCSVSKQQVKRGTFPGRLTYQLHQEVIGEEVCLRLVMGLILAQLSLPVADTVIK